MNKNHPKTKRLIFAALAITIILPVIITPFMYPAFQVFLPPGRIILTPALRIIATICMSIFTYSIVFFLLRGTNKGRKIWFNILYYFLTLFYCCFLGLSWLLAVT